MKAMPVSLLGIPDDAHSSYKRGTAQAPPLIRKALACPSSNTWSESGIDIGAAHILNDLGDLTDTDHRSITRQAARIAADGNPLLALGGDHAITYPVVRGLAEVHGPVDILHFDAHPDLYDELDGDRLSHACPFARIMEAGLATRLVQVGIRGMNGHQREQAERFHVEVHDMNQWDGPFTLKFHHPLYISFDIDALDPAFAPGVSHHEPGGLTVREALSMIQRLEAPAMVGGDIVEYNAERDIQNMTAMVAAKLMKEMTAKIIQVNQ